MRATASRCRPRTPLDVRLAAVLLAGGLVLGACTGGSGSAASASGADRESVGESAEGAGSGSGGESGEGSGDGDGATGEAVGGEGDVVAEVDGIEVRPLGGGTLPVAQAWSGTPLLVQASDDFSGYVHAQSADLVRATDDLVAAVHAGDVPRARALYPTARVPWERVEPLGETATGLDTRIDGKPADLAPGEQLTGFHALEQALWGAPDPAAALHSAGPVADRLAADVRELQAHLAGVQLDPLVIAATTKALLDEATNGKVTCTEEAWSHIELWDLAANLDGVQVAFGSLRAHLIALDPALLSQVDERLAAVRDRLEAHRRGDGWQLCTELSVDERRALSNGVRALTEPVSELEALVVPR